MDWRLRSMRRPVFNEPGQPHEPTFSCIHRYRFPLQGQLQLNRFPGEDFEQVVFVPAATAAFHGDAVAVGMLLEERENQPIEPAEVLAHVLVADA